MVRNLLNSKERTNSTTYKLLNGKAENAVKVIKRLINKSVTDQKDPYLALLDLRNTSSQDIGYSAGQGLWEENKNCITCIRRHA